MIDITVDLMDIHSKRLVSTTDGQGMDKGCKMDIHSKRLVSTTIMFLVPFSERWIYILKDW